MSSRPIEQKQRRRVAKLLRRTPLPAYIDLIEWLKDRGHAQTTGEAKKIILDGRVKADSHVLGIAKIPMLQPDYSVKEEDVVSRHVDARHRGRITVAKA
jgi:hypothetical protein